MRHVSHIFRDKKVRWRNQCGDQVLLWQLALVLIGAVHNAGTGKVAPSQKHICQQKRSEMLQCECRSYLHSVTCISELKEHGHMVHIPDKRG